MDEWLIAGALIVAVVLSALWVIHLRADLARRGVRAGEWSADTDDGGLWSSSARCVRCHSTPVVLTRDGDRVHHECVACGHRDARQTFG